EAVIPEIGDAVAVRDDLVRILGEIGLALEDRAQLPPVAGGLVERVEAPDRDQDVRIDLEDALVGVDRLVDVAELALVDRADLDVDCLLLVRVEDDVRLLLVEAEERLPLLEHEVQLDELVQRPDLFAVDLEDLLVDLDGVLGTLEELLVDGRPAEEVVLLVDRKST